MIRKSSLFTVAAALAIASVANAAVVGFNFGTAAGNLNASTITTGEIASGVASIGNSFGTVAAGGNNSQSVSGTYSGASAAFNLGNAVNHLTLSYSSTSSPFFQFVFTPAANTSLSFTGLNFGERTTGTGAKNYVIASSLDNYASPLASGSFPNTSTWALYNNTFSSAVVSSTPT